MAPVNERMAAARERFIAAAIPVEEAALDARLLARHVLGWSAARLIISGTYEEPDAFAARYEDVVCRRVAREPLSYITGTREFWGLTFAVSPAVLIPRPETEFVVEAALERIPARGTVRVLDLCTGSGCIGVSIAHARPDSRLVGVDISAAALSLARRNAEAHGVSARARWVQMDLLAALQGTFDVIVANPPYVPAAEHATLRPEVRDFEPAAAIVAGPDGLAIVRRMIRQSPAHLSTGGILVFEVGQGQDEAVRELISAVPALTMVSMRADLQGIPRVVIAARTTAGRETES